MKQSLGKGAKNEGCEKDLREQSVIWLCLHAHSLEKTNV